MLGFASSTWAIIGTVSGLIGVLLLFYFGMPGAVQTGGKPLVVANATPEAKAEENRNKTFGYLGLGLTIFAAICAIFAAYS
jgi:hypothetical protein